MRLTEPEIEIAMKKLDGWSRSGEQIKAEFRFKDFRTAFAFMTACALCAEKLDHHPDWSNSYSLVRVQLTTHDAGGLTQKDFDLALLMNDAARPLRAPQTQS